jgi:hypothetical protein
MDKMAPRFARLHDLEGPPVAQALLPTLGSPVLRGYTKTSGGS